MSETSTNPFPSELEATQVVAPKSNAFRIRIVNPGKGQEWRPDVRFISGTTRSEDGFSVSQFVDPLTDQVLEHWKPHADAFNGIWYLLVPAKATPLLDSMFNGRYARAPEDEAKPTPTVRPSVNAIPTGVCLCGCGSPVRSRFLPGHDARLKSLLLATLRAGTIFGSSDPVAEIHKTTDPKAVALAMGWGFLLEKV